MVGRVGTPRNIVTYLYNHTIIYLYMNTHGTVTTWNNVNMWHTNTFIHDVCLNVETLQAQPPSKTKTKQNQ